MGLQARACRGSDPAQPYTGHQSQADPAPVLNIGRVAGRFSITRLLCSDHIRAGSRLIALFPGMRCDISPLHGKIAGFRLRLTARPHAARHNDQYTDQYVVKLPS